MSDIPTAHFDKDHYMNPHNVPSDTPRTDALRAEFEPLDMGLSDQEIEWLWKYADTLERELTALTADKKRLIDACKLVLSEHDNSISDGMWITSKVYNTLRTAIDEAMKRKNTMKTEYTDTQLKQALAKMLPEVVIHRLPFDMEWCDRGREVLDTELLHLCWLVEQGMTGEEFEDEKAILEVETKWYHSATWKQRTIALCKVKGIKII